MLILATKTHVRNWGPVILWMIVIFLFSTELFSSANTTPFLAPLLADLLPNVSAASIEVVVSLVRKLAHWTEYFILAVLLMRALDAEVSSRSAKSRMILTFVWAALYAASDEFHQSFVPGRTASSIDVGIDSFGAICGTLSAHLRNRWNHSSLKSQETSRT
jgi:VanZ family protein